MLGHHLHASEMPFKWCFSGWPMMARLWWYLDPSPIKLKKTKQKNKQTIRKTNKNIKVGPPLTKLSGSGHAKSSTCKVILQWVRNFLSAD